MQNLLLARCRQALTSYFSSFLVHKALCLKERGISIGQQDTLPLINILQKFPGRKSIREAMPQRL